jgi:Flp pilus assembly protein TadD
MSYVLTSELELAEAALREAAASPRATLKIRQNLALVLRLRGNEAEANRLVGAAAPSLPALPTVATGQEDTWRELARS